MVIRKQHLVEELRSHTQVIYHIPSVQWQKEIKTEQNLGNAVTFLLDEFSSRILLHLKEKRPSKTPTGFIHKWSLNKMKNQKRTQLPQNPFPLTTRDQPQFGVQAWSFQFRETAFLWELWQNVKWLWAPAVCPELCSLEPVNRPSPYLHIFISSLFTVGFLGIVER